MYHCTLAFPLSLYTYVWAEILKVLNIGQTVPNGKYNIDLK